MDPTRTKSSRTSIVSYSPFLNTEIWFNRCSLVVQEHKLMPFIRNEKICAPSQGVTFRIILSLVLELNSQTVRYSLLFLPLTTKSTEKYNQLWAEIMC